MTIIDISRSLAAETAVWPGDNPFQLKTTLDMREGAFVNLTSIHTSAHTGSHADAPYHFNPDGLTIEQVDLHKYWGRRRW